jgi:hypothetical protein
MEFQSSHRAGLIPGGIAFFECTGGLHDFDVMVRVGARERLE